jgi:hypothetical protein
MRSLGGGRVPGFGRIDLVDYVRMANAEIMIVPMIEDQQAVVDLPAILAGGGVDLILRRTRYERDDHHADPGPSRRQWTGVPVRV